MSNSLNIRRAREADHPGLEAIRVAAFAPIFASFREILGEAIYEQAQAHEDVAQGEILASMLREESVWQLFVAELDGDLVGFVSIRLDQERKIGEIGLNAMDPTHAGHGLGTQLYEFAIDEMIKAGMKVATVATGGDASHAPARKAYRKAGFKVEIPSVWMCREL